MSEAVAIRSSAIRSGVVEETERLTWGEFMTRSPLFAVVAVFALSAAIVVFAVVQKAEAGIIVGLLAVATLVINIVDRHLKTADTMEQIKANTQITKQIPEKVAQTAAQVATKLVAGDLPSKEVIAENRSDAYGRGFHDGWKERGELGKHGRNQDSPPKAGQ